MTLPTLRTEPDEPEKAAEKSELVLNNWYIRGYAFTLGMGVMQLPFALTGASSMADIYQSFFNWSEDELTFWNSFIGTMAVFGLMVGSLLGGRLIVDGRRRTSLLT